MKNYWVCVDQPTADFNALYPNGAPQRGNIISEQNTAEQDKIQQSDKNTDTKRIVPRQEQNIVRITIVLVLAVVLVTAGLLALFKRKNR